MLIPHRHHVTLSPSHMKTMLELLAYPPMPGEHPSVCSWRSLCASLLLELHRTLNARNDQDISCTISYLTGEEDEDPEIADAANNHGQGDAPSFGSEDSPEFNDPFDNLNDYGD